MFFFIICLVLIFLAGIQTMPSANASTEPGGHTPSRKLIIDTDTGADDVSAIILAASSKDIELLGVRSWLEMWIWNEARRMH